MKATIIKQLLLELILFKPGSSSRFSLNSVLPKPRFLKPVSLVLLSLLSTTALAFDYFVVKQDAGVYSAPGSSQLVTRLTKGNVLLEIDKKGDWSRVFFLSADRQPLKGWMRSDSLTAQQQGQSHPQIAGYTHTVTVNSLRLRKGPGGNYAVVGSLSRDQQVTELQRKGDWVKVGFLNASGNVSEAWTAGRFLRSVAKAPQTQAVASSVTQTKAGLSAGQFSVSGSRVNFRAGPGTSYRVVGQVSAPQQVEVSDSQNGWMNIHFQQGGSPVSGWIAERFLNPVK